MWLSCWVVSQEYEHRFGVWLDNLDFVRAHNERSESYWVSLHWLLAACSQACWAWLGSDY